MGIGIVAFFVLVVLLAILPALGMSFSMGLIVTAGLDAARDPAHRVTPASPWEFYDHAARPIWRRQAMIWSSLLGAIWLLLLLFLSTDRLVGTTSFFHNVMFAGMLPAGMVGLGFLASATYSGYAARIDSFWTMVALAAFISLVSAIAIILLMSALPEGLRMLTFSSPSGDSPSGKERFVLLHPYYVLAVSVALHSLNWRMARKQDAAWFQMDE